MNDITTLPQRILDVLLEEAEAHWTTAQDILEPCRLGHVVRARHSVIRRLRSVGFSTVAIGRLLNMHPSSVHHALKGGTQ